jgi:hypothetical protein
MMFTRFPTITFLAVIVFRATTTGLSNSVQIDASLEEQNAVGNMIIYSLGFDNILDKFISRDLHTRSGDSIECGSVCGSPSTSDCKKLISTIDPNGANVCASPGDTFNFFFDNCVLSFVNYESNQECIDVQGFLQLSNEVLKTCVEGAGTGGCVPPPGNLNFFVCGFAFDQPCFPT